jgi:hypothetical protein
MPRPCPNVAGHRLRRTRAEEIADWVLTVMIGADAAAVKPRASEVHVSEASAIQKRVCENCACQTCVYELGVFHIPFSRTGLRPTLLTARWRLSIAVGDVALFNHHDGAIRCLHAFPGEVERKQAEEG